MDTLKISTILLQHHEHERFADIVEEVKRYAKKGEIFLEFDVRPPFGDTPENWQDVLESAFTQH